MKFDELLYTYLGEFGKYQRLQFFLVCLPTLFTAMHALSWTFSAADIPHRCRLADEDETAQFLINASDVIPMECISGEKKKACAALCSMTLIGSDGTNSSASCSNGYVYDRSLIRNSAVNRWDIVCDRTVIKAVVQSMYYVGQFFGSLVFGFLGDRLGRKRVFFLAIMLQVAAGGLMSIVPNWHLFALLRIAVGFSHPGIFVIAVVIGMELVGPSKRKMAGVITGIFFAIGQVVLGSVAYFIRDYQYLQLAISLPALFFVAYWWVVPESARWLVSHERFTEADRILQKAARMNGSELPENWWERIELAHKVTHKNGDHRKYNLLDLVRTPIIRCRTLAAFICWPVVSMVYYGVSMNPKFLGGDLYVTFIFGGLMEIPALFIVYLLIDRIGRKPLLAGGYFVASVCMLASLFISSDAVIVNVVQYLLTKASITGTYATIYTFTPELFPTVIRNTAMGCCSMVARLGAISASYIAMWLVQYNRLLMVIPFGGLALVAGIVALFLPETNGRQLPETIEEVEREQKNPDNPDKEDREMHCMLRQVSDRAVNGNDQQKI